MNEKHARLQRLAGHVFDGSEANETVDSLMESVIATNKDKGRSRQRALELFPAAHALLARKLDHRRDEPALSVLYGLRNSRLMAMPLGAQPGFNKP
jgi:hypothetical protein